MPFHPPGTLLPLLPPSLPKSVTFQGLILDPSISENSPETETRERRLLFREESGEEGLLSPTMVKMIHFLSDLLHSNFQRDKLVLLQNIQRKDDSRKTAQPTISSIGTPKRKKRAVATRHSPQLHHNQRSQEAGKKVQKRTPTAHRTPAGTHLCPLAFGLPAV